MTHAEALAHRRADLEASDCPEQLRRLGTIRTPRGLLSVWSCPRCRHLLGLVGGEVRWVDRGDELERTPRR